jgi:1,4-alpha-glucan branching enzyme
VILDVVYNHFGPDTNMDLWRFDGWYQEGKGGIYFYNDWRAETPWGNTRPDFGRLEVRQYILDNVKMWVHDCRIDGLRVDSTIFIRNVKGWNNDTSNDLPEGWQLLQQINSIARKINPKIITIAEDVADNEYIVKPVNEGGAGFGSQWELGFPSALRAALWTSDPNQINLTGICTELTRRYNGDMTQRVVFADSHDSASNGASRLAEQIAPGHPSELFPRRQSMIAAALTLTAPGIPMLFQGQELMEGGSFNDWQGVDWSKKSRFQGIIDAYAHLIALRKNSHGATKGLLGQGMNLMHVDQDNKVIAYHRWWNGGPKDDVVVIVNFGDRSYKEYQLGFPRNGKWKVRFNSTSRSYSKDFKNVSVPDVHVDNGGATIVLPPSSAIILSQDD